MLIEPNWISGAGLDISGEWGRPIDLIDDQIGYSTDLAGIPIEPGIYVFGRRWGENVCPLYIGQSLNLRLRMKQHFDSLYLMRAIRGFPNGQRILICCTFELRPGQRIERVLDVVERGLIDRALTEGHELINIHGVRTPKHTVTFSGNRASEQLSGREMFVRKT